MADIPIGKGFSMKRSSLGDALSVAGGGVVFGAAINVFILPNDLVMGGSAGVATVISHFFGGGVGVLNILVNIPLFVIAIRRLGTASMIKTLIGTLAVSVGTQVFAFLPPMTEDLLLCAAAGGGAMGLGAGIMMLRGYTTGGADLAAYMLNCRFPRFSTGRIILAIDALVILLSALLPGSLSRLPYSVVCTVSYGLALDTFTSGVRVCRLAIVISDDTERVASEVCRRLSRGVTVLSGRGYYSGKPKSVLLCAVRRREEFELRRTVLDTDPDAFVIISSCDAMGQGFSPPGEAAEKKEEADDG